MSLEEQIKHFQDFRKNILDVAKNKLENGSLDDKMLELEHIIKSKGKDYANDDKLSVFKGIAESLPFISPERACAVFVMTKIQRLTNLLVSGNEPNNESVEDSMTDLIGYIFLLFCCLEEMKQ